MFRTFNLETDSIYIKLCMMWIILILISFRMNLLLEPIGDNGLKNSSTQGLMNFIQYLKFRMYSGRYNVR